MSSMSPTAYDKWWRQRIEKEQESLAHPPPLPPRRAVIDTLGVPITQYTSIVDPNALAELNEKNVNFANGKANQDDGKSVVSVASNSKSQHLSTVSGNTQILNRLAQLEQAVQEEKSRRLQAEKEMKELMKSKGAENKLKQ